jgi:hypothetical protein
VVARLPDEFGSAAVPLLSTPAPTVEVTEGVLPLNDTVPRSRLVFHRPAVVPEPRRSGERANRLTYEQDDMSVDAREAAGR